MEVPPLRRAAILATGDELVGGRVVDTNSPWLQQRLRSLGIDVVASMQVGDQPEMMGRALEQLAGMADLLVISGGLGPTEDDRTREVMARAGGVELRRNPVAEQQLRAFFEHLGRSCPDSNRRQAEFPEGAAVVPNASGTAPGIWWPRPAGLWIALPGVPSELRSMWAAEVDARLRPVAGSAAWLDREIRVVALSEAIVGERVAQWMSPAAVPRLSITASRSMTRLSLSDRDDAEGRARLDRRERELRACFRPRELLEASSLSEAVVHRLRESSETLALAESCTGGLMAGELTSIPGASAVLVEGCVSYSNDAKVRSLDVPAELIEQEGAVSQPVAEAMARGIRRRSGADWAVSITGVAGPGGGSEEKPVGLVHFAVDGPTGGQAMRRQLVGDREEVRARAVAVALGLLWSRLVQRGT